MVKVRFIDKDPRILPEMSAKAAFLSRAIRPEEQKPRTVVNSNAVIIHKDKNLVFLVKDNRAFETPVTTGEKLGDMIEVLNGVKAGDKVVLKPVDKLRDGKRIKIIEK
jgi:multidrug efflux pump subunit AcrA (membrane-fusion protein)